MSERTVYKHVVVVGNDGLGTFSNEKYDLLLNMDDFIFYGDALTDEDVAKLAEYYDMK